MTLIIIIVFLLVTGQVDFHEKVISSALKEYFLQKKQYLNSVYDIMMFHWNLLVSLF